MFITILKNKHIQFLLLLLVGGILLSLSIRNVPVVKLWEKLATADYGVVFPVLLVSLLGYYFRVLRWRLILGNMQEIVSSQHLYASLCVGYAVNFATPRLGEISRCLLLTRLSKVAIDKALISVFIERIIDVCCLLLILLLAFVVSFGEMKGFLQAEILQPTFKAFMNLPFGLLLITGSSGTVMIFLVYRKIKHHSTTQIVVSRVWKAIGDVGRMNEKPLFLLYSIIIWTCYFLMTYLWFGIFPETNHLGWREAFIIMAVGSVGRSVPIQGGGMGAYHYLVSNVFALFGVSLLLGNAMAFVIHGLQMVMTICLGIIAWIWILIKTEK